VLVRGDRSSEGSARSAPPPLRLLCSLLLDLDRAVYTFLIELAALNLVLGLLSPSVRNLPVFVSS
jgi:hypothetical protein